MTLPHQERFSPIGSLSGGSHTPQSDILHMLQATSMVHQAEVPVNLPESMSTRIEPHVLRAEAS